MENKTTIKLTREEKIALIKTCEILSNLNRSILSDDDSPFDEIGVVLYDLTRIMNTLSKEHNVNFSQLDE